LPKIGTFKKKLGDRPSATPLPLHCMCTPNY
jgi:hypothetical protein